jgi:anti-sigma regulatory factor (Ser/Thr protein kinase)
MEGFSHEALFYAGPRDFAEKVSAFIRQGLEAGEPVLVMVTADRIALLEAELGADAARVLFADMGEAGRNPGRIISAWSDYAAEHLAAGRPLRGVGEPIWAARAADELVECQHHESLLNVAFGHADGFRLLCPYDVESLPPAVLAEARASHPVILDDGRRQECSDYRRLDATGLGDVLPPPTGPSEELSFEKTTLVRVRRFVSGRASDAGLGTDRVEDLVVAVNEAATNSVRHGGGAGVVRLWLDGRSVLCEVRDRGRIDEPLVGRRRPRPGTDGGHGLWMANQLCDLVQVRSRRGGTVVRLHMRLPAAAAAAAAVG